MTAREFIRAIYLASEPPVDLTKVEEVDCRNHTIKEDDYNRIKDEFAGKDTDLGLEADMWLVMSGPRLVLNN